MRRFLVGHASGHPAAALVESALAQIGAVPAPANLGFVYVTDALAAEFAAIVETLKRRTGIAQWTGTVGVGISATGREYYDGPALAIMLAEFPDASFHPIASAPSSMAAFLHQASGWLARDQAHFGLLHCDPGNPAMPALLSQLAEGVPGAFLVGGLGSSSETGPRADDTAYSGPIAGVLFSSDVAVVTSHTQGCTPLAAAHRITACERNIVIELDHRPALDVLKEDIGEVLARDVSRIGGYVFAGFPIAGSDTGDYLVRNLVGIDEARGLVAVGEYLSLEREMMFCRRDGNSARADMQRMLADLARRMGETPRGAVYHSCLGRGRNQFGDDSEELKLIREALGDIPLVGFFANGEIFHNRLYAYTGVLTIFC